MCIQFLLRLLLTRFGLLDEVAYHALAVKCQTSHACLNRGTSKELKYCNNCNGRKYSDITAHLGGHECIVGRCEDGSTKREVARHDIHFHPSWRGKTKTGYDLGKEAITYKRGCIYFVIYCCKLCLEPFSTTFLPKFQFFVRVPIFCRA